jgi:hypothetical protein
VATGRVSGTEVAVVAVANGALRGTAQGYGLAVLDIEALLSPDATCRGMETTW